jgi:hypothetical protein
MSGLYSYLSFCVGLSSAELHDKIKKDSTLRHVKQHPRLWLPLKEHKISISLAVQHSQHHVLHCTVSGTAAIFNFSLDW